MSEQRRFARIEFDSPARLESPQGAQAVRIVDLSLKGALLELRTPVPASPADGYRLTIPLSAADRIVMELELIHLAAPNAGFLCRRIDLESLGHLRRLFELNLADPDLLQRDLGELLRGAP